MIVLWRQEELQLCNKHQSDVGHYNAHDILAGNSRWIPAPTGFQHHFPARVATKFALVSSANFRRENMADDEYAVAAACAIVAILADSHNRKEKIEKYGYTKTDQSQCSVYAGFQRRIEHCAISR